MVWSQLPLAMRLPSGLNATEVTMLSCPFSVRISFPDDTSQILIVVVSTAADDLLPVRTERHAVDMIRVAGERADQSTRGRIPNLDLMAHVPAGNPLPIRAERHADDRSPFPFIVRRSSPEDGSKTRIVSSAPLHARSLPSGLKARGMPWSVNVNSLCFDDPFHSLRSAVIPRADNRMSVRGERHAAYFEACPRSVSNSCPVEPPRP